MSGTNEVMHDVTIDVRKDVFDTEQNRVTETTRESVFNNRIGGTSKLVSVLKAYEAVRTIPKVKGNLNNLEIGVDGSPFQG